jgi:hypothetical protein
VDDDVCASICAAPPSTPTFDNVTADDEGGGAYFDVTVNLIASTDAGATGLSAFPGCICTEWPCFASRPLFRQLLGACWL